MKALAQPIGGFLDLSISTGQVQQLEAGNLRTFSGNQNATFCGEISSRKSVGCFFCVKKNGPKLWFFVGPNVTSAAIPSKILSIAGAKI